MQPTSLTRIQPSPHSNPTILAPGLVTRARTVVERDIRARTQAPWAQRRGAILLSRGRIVAHERSGVRHAAASLPLQQRSSVCRRPESPVHLQKMSRPIHHVQKPARVKAPWRGTACPDWWKPTDCRIGCLVGRRARARASRRSCGVAAPTSRLRPPTRPQPDTPATPIMRLVVATEEGDTFNLDVSNDIELENLQALLEAEVGPLRTSNIPDSTTSHLPLELGTLNDADTTQVWFFQLKLTQLYLVPGRVEFRATRRPSSSPGGR